MLFGPNRAPVGADSISARMAARVFREIIGQYPAVQCRYFVVMPNHFHALVEIERARADMESAPTIISIVQAFKRYSPSSTSVLSSAGKPHRSISTFGSVPFTTTSSAMKPITA